MPKTIYVSEDGFASCPACLNHIQIEQTEREKTVCPFCDETLQVAAGADTEGSRTLDVLRSSRSGLVASALVGAGLSLSVACAEPDPDDTETDAGFNVGEDTGDSDDADGTDANGEEDVNFQNDDNHFNAVAQYGDIANEEPGPPDAGSNDDAGDNQNDENADDDQGDENADDNQDEE